MSWFKMDDQFPRHPKIIQAGNEAAWLYVAGGCYCASYLTDGFIPKDAVATLSTLRDSDRLAVRLVEVGLWHDRGNRYEVHDYLKYNPSREHVEAEREAARLRRQNDGRRGGGTSADVRATKTSPVPSRPEVPTKPSGARKRAVSPDETFQVTDSHRAFAEERGLDLERERERWIVDCEAKGRTYKTLNAGFRTWLDHAVDFGRGKPPAPAPALGFDDPEPIRRRRDPWECRLGVEDCHEGRVLGDDGVSRKCGCNGVRLAVAQ